MHILLLESLYYLLVNLIRCCCCNCCCCRFFSILCVCFLSRLESGLIKRRVLATLYANYISYAQVSRMFELVRSVIYFDLFLQISTSFNFVILRCFISLFLSLRSLLSVRNFVLYNLIFRLRRLPFFAFHSQLNGSQTINQSATRDTERRSSCRSGFVFLRAQVRIIRSRLSTTKQQPKEQVKVSLQLF